MDDMYSPLNEDLMFQQMRDRAARLTADRGQDSGEWPNRRWWHRVTHRAR